VLVFYFEEKEDEPHNSHDGQDESAYDVQRHRPLGYEPPHPEDARRYDDKAKNRDAQPFNQRAHFSDPPCSGMKD
jgi:hypothetical protein